MSRFVDLFLLKNGWKIVIILAEIGRKRAGDRMENMLAFMDTHLAKGDLMAGTKYVLAKLDIPTELKGYRCMAELIPMYHSDPEQSLTKELYPSVGRMFMPELSWEQVEKDIRYAIDKAWTDERPEAWTVLFQKGKPTNEQFISRISQLLDLWERCKTVTIE